MVIRRDLEKFRKLLWNATKRIFFYKCTKFKVYNMRLLTVKEKTDAIIGYTK